MEMEEKSAQPNFWDNAQEAGAFHRKLTQLKEEVATWRGLEKRLSNSLELADLAIAEKDASLEEGLRQETQGIAARLEVLSFQLYLGGEYDVRDAILAIHAGAGGTESQDWAEMLLRMYTRWAERRGYSARVLDMSQGEEAGIKSVTLEVNGRYAYGYLKAEKGVHRLVRISPYDASHLRHTSFALVEVLPQAQENVDVVINSDDLRVDVFRSSGAGGQNVQKTATAVRITHIPTGLVVSCQNERSQLQNKAVAMRVLTARLMELELQKKAQERARLKGEHVEPGWGNQIRSYVLHPYKLVKDHRTDYESANPEAVLEGDLDALIKAYLESQVGKEAQG